MGVNDEHRKTDCGIVHDIQNISKSCELSKDNLGEIPTSRVTRKRAESLPKQETRCNSNIKFKICSPKNAISKTLKAHSIFSAVSANIADRDLLPAQSCIDSQIESRVVALKTDDSFRKTEKGLQNILTTGISFEQAPIYKLNQNM